MDSRQVTRIAVIIVLLILVPILLTRLHAQPLISALHILFPKALHINISTPLILPCIQFLFMALCRVLKQHVLYTIQFTAIVAKSHILLIVKIAYLRVIAFLSLSVTVLPRPALFFSVVQIDIDIVHLVMVQMVYRVHIRHLFEPVSL